MSELNFEFELSGSELDGSSSSSSHSFSALALLELTLGLTDFFVLSQFTIVVLTDFFFNYIFYLSFLLCFRSLSLFESICSASVWVTINRELAFELQPLNESAVILLAVGVIATLASLLKL